MQLSLSKPDPAALLAFMRDHRVTPDGAASSLRALGSSLSALERLRKLFPESARPFADHSPLELANEPEDIGWRLVKAQKLECYRHFFPAEFEASKLTPETPTAEWMQAIVRFYELVDARLFPVHDGSVEWMLDCYDEECSVEEAEINFIGLREIPLESYFPSPDHGVWDMPIALQLMHFFWKGFSAIDLTWCAAEKLPQFEENSWTQTHWDALKQLCRRKNRPLSYVNQVLQVTCQVTGNTWIDWDPESCCGDSHIDWAIRPMKYLAKEYRAADSYADKVTALSAWMNEDLQRVWDVVLLLRQAMAPAAERRKLRNPDPLPDLRPQNRARIMVRG